MISRIVLDSWAILAWLQGEAAGEVVRDLVAWVEGDEAAGVRAREQLGGITKRPKLFVNLINLGEVFYLLGRRRGEREGRETVEEIMSSPIEVVPASEEIVFAAAMLKLKHPIAHADGFALATAESLGAALVTGDPELKDVEGASILWIGQGK